jgi:hypothetical protein
MLKVVVYDGDKVFVTKKFKFYSDAYAFIDRWFGDYRVILEGKGK